MPSAPFGQHFVLSVSLCSAVGRGRNADLDDVAVTKLACRFDGVLLVGLDLLVGLSGGLGGRGDDALEAELEEPACEDETGRPRLVADLQVAERDLQFRGQFAQCALGGDEGAGAFAVVDGVLPAAADRVGDSD